MLANVGALGPCVFDVVVFVFSHVLALLYLRVGFFVCVQFVFVCETFFCLPAGLFCLRVCFFLFFHRLFYFIIFLREC